MQWNTTTITMLTQTEYIILVQTFCLFFTHSNQTTGTVTVANEKKTKTRIGTGENETKINQNNLKFLKISIQFIHFFSPKTNQRREKNMLKMNSVNGGSDSV